jgi:hypothetical protein
MAKKAKAKKSAASKSTKKAGAKKVINPFPGGPKWPKGQR